MTLAPAHVAGAGMIRFGKYPVDVTFGVDGRSMRGARRSPTPARP